MMENRNAPSRFSADVVKYLLSHGMTLTQIADTLKVSKSYISRVKSRQRSLTVDHLLALERVVGKPLPLLLFEAIPLESVPAELKLLYEATGEVLRFSAGSGSTRKTAVKRRSIKRPRPSTTAPQSARRKAG